jgi:hypothetical protein
MTSLIAGAGLRVAGKFALEATKKSLPNIQSAFNSGLASKLGAGGLSASAAIAKGRFEGKPTSELISDGLNSFASAQVSPLGAIGLGALASRGGANLNPKDIASDLLGKKTVDLLTIATGKNIIHETLDNINNAVKNT